MGRSRGFSSLVFLAVSLLFGGLAGTAVAPSAAGLASGLDSAARSTSAVPGGRVVVVFRAPDAVPVSIRLEGKRNVTITRVEAQRTARLVVPAGRYRVVTAPSTVEGTWYETQAKATLVVPRSGSVRLPVTVSVDRTAVDLATTSVASDGVGLEWRSPPSARAALRRTLGDEAPSTVRGGVEIPLAADSLTSATVTDTAVGAGTTYTYVLFARVGRNWVPSRGLTVTTPGDESEPAAVVKPGSIVVDGSDRHRVTVDQSGRIVLDPAASRPDLGIGSGVVLAPTPDLPGGLIATVRSIDAQGRATLTEGSLVDVFDYLDVTADLADLPERVASDATARGGRRIGPTWGWGCQVSSGIEGSIQVEPRGSLDVRIDTNAWHVPTSVHARAEVSPVVTTTVEASVAASCDFSVGADIQFAAGPVPLLLSLDLHASIEAAGMQTLTVGTRVGAWGSVDYADGEVRTDGGSISRLEQATLDPSSELAVEIGADVDFGPGLSAGKGVAGGVAGLAGNIAFLRASLRNTADDCLEFDLQSGSTLKFGTKVWLGPLVATRYLVLADELKSHPNHPRTLRCEPEEPSDPKDPRGETVSAGDYHTCSIRAGGQLWCWGMNVAGQLGLDDTTDRDTPTRVDTGTDWTDITAGAGHSCGIRAGGQLWCWGQNNFGQLGLDDASRRNIPTRVGAGTDWTDITAGAGHTCGIRAGGQLWCWGQNNFGQLGLDDTTDRDTPTRVGTATDWTTIDPGLNYSCGIRDDKQAWCWGQNKFGQLGLDDTTDRDTPTRLDTATDWTTITTGYVNSCGIRADGQAWCWGWNRNGQLGLGDTIDRDTPTRVGTGTDWTTVIAGTGHTCGIRAGGQAWCWGSNYYGQLGLGDTTDRRTPTRVGTGTDWTAISPGFDHTCGAQSGGKLSCWGYNAYGALGLGDAANRNTPTQLS